MRGDMKLDETREWRFCKMKKRGDELMNYVSLVAEEGRNGECANLAERKQERGERTD